MNADRVRYILGRYVLNGVLALIVIGLVATLFNGQTQPRWANLSEFHAHWDINTGTVEASIVIDKHQQCRRVVVNKNLRPLVENDVLPVDVPLNGKLASEFLEAPLGTSTRFDRAKPRSPLPPGQYVITMTALCEAENPVPTEKTENGPQQPPLAQPTVVQPTPELLATEPITSLIVVPKIPVRLIPRGRD